MRKLLMTIGAAVLLTESAQAADNYTCATPPSCASLGYTLTSTTNCVGTVLKCPFDTTKYYCTQKDTVVNMLVPNYDIPKEFLPNGTYYTVGSGALAAYSCGWVLFRSQETNTAPSEWWINTALVGAQKGDPGHYADYNSAMYFVTKGDKFKLIGRTGSGGEDKLFFFPCKNY